MIQFNVFLNNWKLPALPGRGEWINLETDVSYVNSPGIDAFQRYYSKNNFKNHYSMFSKKIRDVRRSYEVIPGFAYDVFVSTTDWETWRITTHYNRCYDTCWDRCSTTKCNVCGSSGETKSNCRPWGICTWTRNCNPYNCNPHNCNPWKTYDQIQRQIFARYNYTPHRWNYEGLIAKNYSHRTI